MNVGELAGKYAPYISGGAGAIGGGALGALATYLLMKRREQQQPAQMVAAETDGQLYSQMM